MLQAASHYGVKAVEETTDEWFGQSGNNACTGTFAHCIDPVEPTQILPGCRLLAKILFRSKADSMQSKNSCANI
jgi:hypothetical protein